MLIPDKLQKGDTVAIIATARKISKEEIRPAKQLLETWGFNVILGENLFQQDHQFAGTITQRSSDLQKMINNSSVKAIFCARGGYGSIQIIDAVDFSPLQLHPKWIVGYSDITVLHSHLHQLGIASLHASMPINFPANSPSCLDSLYDAITGRKYTISCDAHPLNRLGEVEGEIIGGNLSVLFSILGSKSDINTDGKILFLEDLDEYLYHIDRMMINLKRNGKLDLLKALIVGGMTQMKDNAIPFGKTAEEIIFNYIQEFSYPVCFHFPAGHQANNQAVPFGLTTQLKIAPDQVLLSC